MKRTTQEQIARFFFDCSKVSFTVLVIGMIAQKTHGYKDLAWGIYLTLTFFVFAIIISEARLKEAR